MVDRIEDRFRVIAESVLCLRGQFCRRPVKFIKINPGVLQEKLRPHQQDFLWNERAKTLEARIPKFPAHQQRPRPRRNIHVPRKRFQTSHSLATATRTNPKRARRRLQFIQTVNGFDRIDKKSVRRLQKLVIRKPFAFQTRSQIANRRIVMVQNRRRP